MILEDIQSPIVTIYCRISTFKISRRILVKYPNNAGYRQSIVHVQISQYISAVKYLNIALVVNVANNIYSAHMRLKFPVNLQGTKVHIFDSKNPIFVGLNHHSHQCHHHHSQCNPGLKSLEQGLLCSL